MLGGGQTQTTMGNPKRTQREEGNLPMNGAAGDVSAARDGDGDALKEANRTLEAQLADLQQKHGRLHRALFDAEQVQRKLCAPGESRLGSFDIASEVFPVRYLSGDFYDVVEVNGRTALAVGDIAGKGIVASLWFAHMVSLVRVHVAANPDPATAMEAINRDLMQLRIEPPMASLFLGWLDSNSGELFYCNAGHPPSLVLRREGTVDALGEGGPVLGVLVGARFEAGRAAIQPGDTLIGYSDGILECRNCTGEEFGTERLLEAAHRTQGGSAKTMLFSILGAVQDFAGSCPREDDFTLMVARRY
jgi:sigma-B regulation protein RsbU (phosphoserine phosphatase)